MHNVIIVEDDLMVCAILERQLGRFQQLKLLGSFRRGSDALEWMEENPDKAELIVLDYYMPNMTGVEFLEKLRETNKDIQVIMITSANEYSVICAAMCCGICDYILKPFNSARLEKAVSRFDTVMKLKEETHVWTQEKVDILLCPHKHYSLDSSEDAMMFRANKINAGTLSNIRDYMQTKLGMKLPLTAISEEIGLSTVTVRRYLKHMNTLGEISITLDCKTGGRPSEIYEYIGAGER